MLDTAKSITQNEPANYALEYSISQEQIGIVCLTLLLMPYYCKDEHVECSLLPTGLSVTYTHVHTAYCYPLWG